MENPEIEILLIEDDPKDAEIVKRILQKNSMTTNKVLHLRDSTEANDFIFCEGKFAQRNIFNQPKTIFLNTLQMKISDIKFLKKINSAVHTKNIAVVTIAFKREGLGQSVNEQHKHDRKLLSGLYDLTNI